MEYKLNRLFNIVSPIGLIQIAIIACGSAVICSVYTYHWKSILVLSALLLIPLFYLLIWVHPKVLEIKDGQISYWRQQVRRKVNGYTPALWVFYRVSGVSFVALKQTRLERLFDVGHITFRGNTDFEVKKEKHRKKVFIPSIHRVYGIRNFSRVSREIARQFPNVVIDQ